MFGFISINLDIKYASIISLFNGIHLQLNTEKSWFQQSGNFLENDQPTIWDSNNVLMEI